MHLKFANPPHVASSDAAHGGTMAGLGEVRFRTLVEQRELSMDQAGTVPLLLLRRGGQRWLDNARAKIKYASMQQAASNVVLVTDDVSRVRYQDQGNADLSASADAFKQRQKLRRSPIVLEALDEWWSVSLRRVHRYRPDATSLVWAEYCAVYKAIYADLLGADAYDLLLPRRLRDILRDALRDVLPPSLSHTRLHHREPAVPAPPTARPVPPERPALLPAAAEGAYP